ncbi:MAG: CBS domain-containing protein [Acidobacteriota bacterium]|nr:MAG: CBS domain-containing protein [Acidobacteriota bacterium]
MDLLKIARTPPVTIGPRASVLDAVELMSDCGAGAVIMVDGGRAIGIFTASDLLRRVVAKSQRLDVTPLADVASSPLTVAHADTGCERALTLMVKNHIRHLPIVDERAHVQGMLSTRHLLRCMVDDLSQELVSLDAYHCADSIGG